MEKQSPMLRLWELGEKELDFYLSFGSGLADGSAVPCINSGRYDFYDGRYERLRRPVRGGGSVKTTQAMNSTIVEYIGGIEVIKAFNQGKNSYAKYSDRVRANPYGANGCHG